MNGPALQLDLPEGWVHRDDVAPFALVARPARWDGPFTPNLTVTVTPRTEGESPEAYLAAQLDGTARALADPLLVDAHADRAAGTVSFVVAHATAGVDVTAAQHHRLGDRWVVAACATALDTDWPLLAADLVALAASVREAP